MSPFSALCALTVTFPAPHIIDSTDPSVDKIAVYKIDQATGRLGEAGHYPAGNGANRVENVDIP